ncbi:17450_t:CDS:2 [Dentiscutata erythropus]|uniref:17450_t:CDS:1 n=1 Tax=Dentiscutata erythropus TaxID=1348616 RepID=A0A9N9DMX8_9GLOM|nr:17450_t:CDS:2 [Dentiscutata erythropus]
MPRNRRHTRSDNLTPNENLEQFLVGHLEQENTQLCRDLEYELAINRRTINNLRNQVNILENRENIFTAVLNNQGQVIPRLRRQDAFIYKVEEDFETSD